MHRILLLLVPFAAAVVVLAGTSGAPSPSPAAARPVATVQVQGSPYGRVLFDGRGYALYVFTADRRRESRCAGACAKAWPPLIVRGRLRAGHGARRSLLGSIRRRDGRRQATYAGRPLYFYVGDTRAGQISCQDVVEYGGTWLVQRADGRPVKGR
jgi:predicted lipoprotein with Yx(FWY)xxD motif